jgi:hypothetical protein
VNHFRRNRSAARGVIAALAAAAIALFTAAGPAGEPPAPPPPKPAAFSEQLSRIVSARVLHTRIPTVRKSNSRRIGNWLASLRPTWVTGLLRYRKGQHPNGREIRAWQNITRIVRLGNPEAQFDVALNIDQYKNADQIRLMMDRIRARLGNDGWFLDFMSTYHRKHPGVVRSAIDYAHANGEWIGGNVFGIRHRRGIPYRADYLAVQDHGLRLNLPAVRKLAAKLPVVYHLHNHPDRPRGGGCRFIEHLSARKRRKHVRQRAAQQVRFGFRVSYPALFPACRRERAHRDMGFLYSYNAFRDRRMAKTIRALLDRYQ